MFLFSGLVVFCSLLLGGYEVRRLALANVGLMERMEWLEDRMEYLEESLQDVYDFSIDID